MEDFWNARMLKSEVNIRKLVVTFDVMHQGTFKEIFYNKITSHFTRVYNSKLVIVVIFIQLRDCCSRYCLLRSIPYHFRFVLIFLHKNFIDICIVVAVDINVYEY